YNGSPIAIQTAQATSFPNGWLLPSFSAGSNVLTVGINATSPTTLTAGPYSGSITITTSVGQLIVPVNLQVGGVPSLNVAPTALNFAYQVGATLPNQQSIAISSSTQTQVSYNVTSFVSSGNTNWLVVSPQGVSATPNTLTVSVSPTGLTA